MTVPLKIIAKSELQELPNQKQVWETISKPWKKYVIKKIPIVVEFLKDKKGKVVDFGCGTGRNIIPENKDLSYVGIDFAKGQISHAKRYVKKEKIKGEFFLGDVCKLDKNVFGSNKFDYGLFISTLHCLETKQQREQALKEFYRVLKPGALALISVWNSEDPRFKKHIGDVYLSWYEQGAPLMRYYYLYKKREFLGLLKKVGFKVLELYEPKLHDRFSKKNWVVRVEK